MNYLLDTNACISYLNNPQSPVRYKLERLNRNAVFVCSVVKAELYFGVMYSQRPKRNRKKLELFLKPFGSFPFDDAAAIHYGEIRAKLSRAGKLIGPHDLQIAAIALTQGPLSSHITQKSFRVLKG